MQNNAVITIAVIMHVFNSFLLFTLYGYLILIYTKSVNPDKMLNGVIYLINITINSLIGHIKFINQILSSGDNLPQISDVIELFNESKSEELSLIKNNSKKSQETNQPIAQGDIELYQAYRYLSENDLNYLILTHNIEHGSEELNLNTKLSTSGYVLCLKPNE